LVLWGAALLVLLLAPPVAAESQLADVRLIVGRHGRFSFADTKVSMM
jgi:hypothetical protein